MVGVDGEEAVLARAELVGLGLVKAVLVLVGVFFFLLAFGGAIGGLITFVTLSAFVTLSTGTGFVVVTASGVVVIAGVVIIIGVVLTAGVIAFGIFSSSLFFSFAWLGLWFGLGGAVDVVLL